MYCSQLWSPRCLKDITRIETIQRRMTRFLVSSPHPFNYRDRLIDLQLLPLMYHHDLRDVLFIIKCLLSPPDNFDILQYVSFSTHGTRTTSAGKLKVNFRRISTTRHFYFNRVVRLWNTIPSHCIPLPTAPSRGGCKLTFEITFYYIFHLILLAHSTTFVLVHHVFSNNHFSCKLLIHLFILYIIIILFWLQHMLLLSFSTHCPFSLVSIYICLILLSS